ncbi:hypothetical protein B0T16DRAFT_364136 [Cercophora newfieldiana]|uniref:Zn(2)-C6 fungal-type domain-containing protein n=1 Tax=Cercophora newfieldiana TaxID=92897 RepID=A0AA39YN38_9PEZI|nr:hypothetical protein B0T16DRAFT_364136 [Cercophora newfieldiana]
MRHTLRRSCATCAKSKLGCDLATPRCSRCARRGIPCIYANQPLTAKPSHQPTKGSPGALTSYNPSSLDPFDSYPRTRLSRDHVQRLIHSFINKIAFEYYPLDLNAASNPFLISWWPLALGDPALFHVTLQTACLDEELIAQKGFATSHLLMADSVALLRRKVEDTALAVQDGTMNSVITLATIEFGKGNTELAEMHVEGVKKLVDLRGGINAVRQTSPLTARMVSWVSLIITGSPQFQTQDNVGIGDGIPPVPEWQLGLTLYDDLSEILDCFEIDSAVLNVFIRLRNILQRAQQSPLPSTHLHDLTCFVVHRLLHTATDPEDSPTSPTTECLRYAIALFLFTAQGPTYYSHAVIFSMLASRFTNHLKRLSSTPRAYGSLAIWLHGVGMVAAAGTNSYEWLIEKTWETTQLLHVADGEEAMARLKTILWVDTPHAEALFRSHWDGVFERAGSCRKSNVPAATTTMVSSFPAPALAPTGSVLGLQSE